MLAELPECSVDAIVTDPPYAIGRFGQKDEKWDGRAVREKVAQGGPDRLGIGKAYELWCREWSADCFRVLKPGAHMVVFGSPRTSHRLAVGIEDVGLEIRDTLIWLRGDGTPKSRRLPGDRATTLKPAHEPILLARRPPVDTVKATIDQFGTGALEVGACRTDWRYPANVVLSHSAGCSDQGCLDGCAVSTLDSEARNGPGGVPASRFFYCAKVTRRERDAGCEYMPARRLDLPSSVESSHTEKRKARNPHPTVKPIELMRWLIRLACPPDALVLDPFCGSGSTGAAAALEGRRFLGIELDREFAEIAAARIEHWSPDDSKVDRAPLGIPA
ncbi:MAG TPA: site-specific DNA-methyltransferase [Solirubrobacterales bacterium]|nr:site-specific DNA-methyltransferase [Solirubrobacterales bacterium]